MRGQMYLYIFYNMFIFARLRGIAYVCQYGISDDVAGYLRYSLENGNIKAFYRHKRDKTCQLQEY